MANKNIKLKDGQDTLFPQTKVSLLMNDDGTPFSHVIESNETIAINIYDDWKKGYASDFCSQVSLESLFHTATETGQHILQHFQVTVRGIFPEEPTREDTIEFDAILNDFTMDDNSQIVAHFNTVLSGHAFLFGWNYMFVDGYCRPEGQDIRVYLSIKIDDGFKYYTPNMPTINGDMSGNFLSADDRTTLEHTNGRCFLVLGHGNGSSRTYFPVSCESSSDYYFASPEIDYKHNTPSLELIRCPIHKGYDDSDWYRVSNPYYLVMPNPQGWEPSEQLSTILVNNKCYRVTNEARGLRGTDNQIYLTEKYGGVPMPVTGESVTLKRLNGESLIGDSNIVITGLEYSEIVSEGRYHKAVPIPLATLQTFAYITIKGYVDVDAGTANNPVFEFMIDVHNLLDPNTTHICKVVPSSLTDIQYDYSVYMEIAYDKQAESIVFPKATAFYTNSTNQGNPKADAVYVQYIDGLKIKGV